MDVRRVTRSQAQSQGGAADGTAASGIFIAQHATRKPRSSSLNGQRENELGAGADAMPLHPRSQQPNMRRGEDKGKGPAAGSP